MTVPESLRCALTEIRKLSPAGGAARIMFLARNMQVGGAEQQLLLIAKGLQETGHDVTVTLFYDSGLLMEPLRNSGVRIELLDKRGRWDFIRCGLRLIRLVRARGPHVVHGYLDVPNLLLALMRPLFPKSTYVVWGFRASDMSGAHDSWITRAVELAHPYASRWANLIIANSHSGASYLKRRGIDGNKILVVPNAIDTDRFRPDPESRRRVRASLGVDDSQPLIGIVARLARKKNHDLFLRSAAELIRRNPNTRFVCVGDGFSDYVAHLRSLSESLKLDGALQWLGTRSDVAEIYNALDVMCLTSSRGEGFPNVLGEAMSCGTACASTEVGDAAEILGDVGGGLTSTYTPEGFADCVEYALGLGKEPMRAARRKRVEDLFSREALVIRTMEALGHLPCFEYHGAAPVPLGSSAC